MTVALRVNGVDLRALGLYLQGMPGFENMPARKVVSVSDPREFGMHLARVDGVGGRQLVIEAAIAKSSVAARIAAADRVKVLFSRGLNRVERDLGGVVRIAYGVLDGEPQFVTRRAWRESVTIMRIVLACPNPFWLAQYGTAVGYTGTAASIPLGAGPSAVLFRVMGTGAANTFTVRNAWGDVVHQIVTPSLATTAFAEIDNRDRKTIEKVDSGTRSSIIATSTISGTFPFALDHTYGSYEDALWPTFEATGHAEALYRKTYP